MDWSNPKHLPPDWFLNQIAQNTVGSDSGRELSPFHPDTWPITRSPSITVNPTYRAVGGGAAPPCSHSLTLQSGHTQQRVHFAMTVFIAAVHKPRPPPPPPALLAKQEETLCWCAQRALIGTRVFPHKYTHCVSRSHRSKIQYEIFTLPTSVMSHKLTLQWPMFPTEPGAPPSLWKSQTQEQKKTEKIKAFSCQNL